MTTMALSSIPFSTDARLRRAQSVRGKHENGSLLLLLDIFEHLLDDIQERAHNKEKFNTT